MSTIVQGLSLKSAKTRLAIMQMIAKVGRGHIGGAFSCTEIMVCLYYGGILNIDPQDPLRHDRDRFIMSKGHSVAALYVILADLGIIPAKYIETYGANGCPIGGHPIANIPGIEIDSGSLGHGLSIACGIALAAKMDLKDFKTFVLLGDGECCEGSVWEAAMFAGKKELDNLIAIVDNNGICATDFVCNCVCNDDLPKRWESFRWDVYIADGHDIEDLLNVLHKARSSTNLKPKVIIANTIKGKGVSFMEGSPQWHHGAPKGQMLEQAIDELQRTIKSYERP